MTLFQGFFLLAVLGFTVTAAVSDYRTRRLPNWLTVTAFFAALIVHTAIGGLTGLGLSLSGFATGFSILLVLWLLGGGGGGDVKLMGALGAWLGPLLTLRVFLVSAVVLVIAAGGALVLAFLGRGFHYVRRRYMGGRWVTPRAVLDADEKWLAQRQRFRILPYAVPVALSTWLVLALAWKTACLPL